MKQVKVILVAITQLHHKIQIKHPQVSQDTITFTNNKNTKYKYIFILLNMK
jgi:hypothetical protein